MSAFVDDIRGQGEALRSLISHATELADVVSELDLESFDRIVLSGMGGSHYGAYPAWLNLVERRLPAWWIETAELLHHAPRLVDDRTLLWLTSQSGESAEVAALLRSLPAVARPTIVGLTNVPQSTLGQAADYVLQLHAGTENAVSTKTYVNTLATFALSLTTAGADRAIHDLTQSASALDAWAGSLDEAVEEATSLLLNAKSIVITGRGASLAAARAGALTIKEAAKTHAEALGAGAFRHGPVELAGPDLTVLVLGGDSRTIALNQALAQDVATYGAVVLWVGEGSPAGVPVLPSPEFDGPLGRSIAEIAALQVCSVALARLHAIEPGVFRFATKITTIQ